MVGGGGELVARCGSLSKKSLIAYVPYDDGGPSEEGGRTTVWVTGRECFFPAKSSVK
jgi:hypothetical protein